MEQILDILTREVDNDHHIYLYRENGRWCAYEQSACQISTLLKGCRLEKVVVSACEIMLVKAVLECDEALHGNNLPAHVSVVMANENFMKLRKCAGLEYDVFNYWKKVVTRDRKSLVLATV